MRLLITCVIFLALAATLSAQDMTPVTCPDGTPVTPQMTISLSAQPRATPNEQPELTFVSVLTDQNVPMIASTQGDGTVGCAVDDGLAGLINIAYGQETAAGIENLDPSPYSTWIGIFTDTEATISIGQLANYAAIVIEDRNMPRNNNTEDVYTFTIDPVQFVNAESGSEEIFYFNVSLLSTDGAYIPGFSFLNDDGSVVTSNGIPQHCIPDDCPLDVGNIGIKYNSAWVPNYTSQTRDGVGKGADLNYTSEQHGHTIHLRVEDTNTKGQYALIVSFRVKTPQPKTIPAQAIPNGDGSWTLRCDGQEVFTNGVKVSLGTPTSPVSDLATAEPAPSLTSSITPETPLTITALGADSPVTMAVMTSPTEGYCAPIAPTTSSYSLTLPDLTTAPTLNSAQVKLESQPAFVLVGSAQPSTLTLMVEGWKTPLRPTLVAEENPDLAAILQPLLTLDVTPALINSGSNLRVYAIAADDLADAAVGVVNADGQPLTDANGAMACNDAGVPDQCPVGSTSLTGYTVTLGDGRVLPGASLDAMLAVDPTALPLEPDATLGADVAKLHIAAADRTGAGGSLIFVLGFALSQ